MTTIRKQTLQATRKTGSAHERRNGQKLMSDEGERATAMISEDDTMGALVRDDHHS